MESWRPGSKRTFSFYREYFEEGKSSAKESFKYLTKYLATFSDEDAHTTGEAKGEAVQTIIEFVKTPDMFQCTECVFGLNQWQSLRTKLATWRGNIANVITTIQANKVGEDGAQLMQGLMIH